MIFYLLKGKTTNYLVTDSVLKSRLNNGEYVNIIGTYTVLDIYVKNELDMETPDNQKKVEFNVDEK